MEDKKTTDYSPLLEGLLTVSDRDVFLGQLEELEQQMFKQPFSEVITSILPYDQKAAFENILRQAQIPENDLVKIQDQIRGVREYISSIPVLSVTVAEPPREAVLRKILLAVSDQTHQPLFLAVAIDSSILGGSKLEWGGKVEDYSLEKRLEDYFGKLKNQQGDKPMEVN